DIDDELTCAQSDFSDKSSFVKELAKNKRKNSVYRANCASPICVVPLTDEDEPEGFWVQCDFCHRHVHSKCAGLKGKDAGSNGGDDEYKCYLCQGVRTKDKLVDVHKESLKISKAELQRVEKKHASLHSRLDSVFVDVKKHQGPLELQLNNVLEKELLVYKQAYHSNAFIGNHCRKIIEKPHGLVAVLLRHGFPEIH
ncbi:PHD finger domain-containing protein, partial [Bartonella sp. CL48QHWL]|uniref:PHD finger domain-containing protein n=1 Tax=Bartonella sp. CL48QHWL TaxID=3243535 RepID=UPI0035D0F008